MKKIIKQGKAGTVAELRDLLASMTLDNADTIYTRAGFRDDVRLQLEEETLTDGSVVYNILVS